MRLKKISALIFAIVIVPLGLIADTQIANGKLYSCRGTSIVSATTGAPVSARSARARYNLIIAGQSVVLGQTEPSTSAYRRAQKKIKNAKMGLRNIRSCREGTLDRSSLFLGGWVLLTEDGKTPAELGYNSLTLDFTVNEFSSDYDGSSLDCHWEGSYTLSGSQAIVMRTDSGTGGVVCEQSVNQSRSAVYEFSDNNNRLTIDYSPNGTLQVFGRIV